MRAADLARAHRERLVRNGFLLPVMKGWYIAGSPDEGAGDSTAWYTSFWGFCADYLRSRLDADWCLSPEQSLSLHAGNWSIPGQLLVRAPKGRNNATILPHGTSVLEVRSTVPDIADIVELEGVQVFSLPAALVACSARFFGQGPVDARTAIALVMQQSGTYEGVGGSSCVCACVCVRGRGRKVGDFTTTGETKMKKTSAAFALAALVAFGGGGASAEEVEQHLPINEEEEKYPWRIIVRETKQTHSYTNDEGEVVHRTYYHDPAIEPKMYSIVAWWLADETREKALWEAIRDDETLSDYDRWYLLRNATRPYERIEDKRYYSSLLHRAIGYGARSNSGTVQGTHKSENIFPAPGRIYDPENWGPWAFQIFAKGGKDHVIGSKGNDWIDGGMGDDRIEGRGGDDVIFGGRGNDYLYGGRGDDILIGGRGDDVIDPGPGDDFVFPGYGADTVAFGQHYGDYDTLLLLASEGGDGDLFEFAGSVGNLYDWEQGRVKGISSGKLVLTADQVYEHMLPEVNLNGHTFRLHISAVATHYLSVRCKACPGSHTLNILGLQHSVRPHEIEDGTYE